MQVFFFLRCEPLANFSYSKAKTSMSSKIIGTDSDYFSNLAVTAALKVKTEKDGKLKCPISNIHILKSHGQSALDSALIDGFALNCTRAAQGMPTCVRNAKVLFSNR
jgi:T-complex protein 1 subunit alpha